MVDAYRLDMVDVISDENMLCDIILLIVDSLKHLNNSGPYPPVAILRSFLSVSVSPINSIVFFIGQ